jgi:hypothetical protein
MDGDEELEEEEEEGEEGPYATSTTVFPCASRRPIWLSTPGATVTPCCCINLILPAATVKATPPLLPLLLLWPPVLWPPVLWTLPLLLLPL